MIESNIPKRHLQWYSNVLKMSEAHDSYGHYSMTAIAVKGNRILSVGYNYYPHRRGGKHFSDYVGCGTHAEYQALSGTNTNLNGATLYIAGVSKIRNEINSKPCARCNNLLMNSNLKQIVYYDAEKQEITIQAIKNLTPKPWSLKTPFPDQDEKLAVRELSQNNSKGNI